MTPVPTYALWQLALLALFGLVVLGVAARLVALKLDVLFPDAEDTLGDPGDSAPRERQGGTL